MAVHVSGVGLVDMELQVPTVDDRLARAGVDLTHVRWSGAAEQDTTMSELIAPRRRPCASCPYRRDVPSGIWAAEEYDKLSSYDGCISDQAIAGAFHVFVCHTKDGQLCAGWVGCHDMQENLAIRMRGDLDYEEIVGYESPVPLFASGAEAAAHGKRDIANPRAPARRKIGHLMRRRSSAHLA